MAGEDSVILSDGDLQRMLKNLKAAFSDACQTYEYKRRGVEQRYIAASERDTAAAQLAQVSGAYLQASAEKRRRDEEKTVISDLGKPQTLKLPPSAN